MCIDKEKSMAQIIQQAWQRSRTFSFESKYSPRPLSYSVSGLVLLVRGSEWVKNILKHVLKPNMVRLIKSDLYSSVRAQCSIIPNSMPRVHTSWASRRQMTDGLKTVKGNTQNIIQSYLVLVRLWRKGTLPYTGVRNVNC